MASRAARPRGAEWPEKLLQDNPDIGLFAGGGEIDVPASQQATPFTEQAAIPSAVHAPMAPNRGLELPSMATLIQPADPGYDQWRAAMDAARGKRRRDCLKG